MSGGPDVSPYDPLWGWVALATASWSITVALTLTTGFGSPIPNPDALMQDDRRATVAYYGILGAFGGLAALGKIAAAYVRSGCANYFFPWPRLPKIEGETRTAYVAKVALGSMLLLPILAGAVSAFAYVKTSRISCWDSHVALANGFWTSRRAVIDANCSGAEYFRMAPLDAVKPDAHQWFIMSDVLALVIVVLCFFSWSRYFYLIRSLGKAR